MNTAEMAERNKIFECVAGSHAYGMATPTSDIDYRGIFVGEPVNIITPFYPVEQVQGEGDRVLYEVSKFLKLAIDQNPNIMELLWVDEQSIIYQTETYKLLRSRRHNLLSSKVAHTFTGYAMSQMRRIRGHNKWINNPQSEERPKQVNYLRIVSKGGKGIDGERLDKCFVNHSIQRFYGHTYGIYQNQGKSLSNPDGSLILNNKPVEDQNPVMLVVFDQEQYERDFNNWKGYWDWKEKRNKKRSKLEEEHGFDTKHASHLIRLLRMGKEILQDGIVMVMRPDAEELLAIRNGSLSYDQLIEMSEDLQNEIEHLKKSTSLPKTVNLKMASNLLIDVYESSWGKRIR